MQSILYIEIRKQKYTSIPRILQIQYTSILQKN